MKMMTIVGKIVFLLAAYSSANLECTLRKNLAQCRSDQYGSYRTFASARTACASDSNCEAVYDENCDNSGFSLCPVNYVEDISFSSCLYLKTELKMTSAGIDWAAVRKKLPYERTEEQEKKRMDMFKQFDPNANGILSLAETEKGIRDVLRCDALFANKRPIHRAFRLAKKATKGKRVISDDYLEKREFRPFLQLLRQYIEYMQAFSRLDTGDDNRISKEEFTNPEVKSIVELWVGPIADMAAEFDTIVKNGDGQILFDEFADWATAKNLDIEDDDE